MYGSVSSEVRDWLTAIGTVGAVIVAVASAWWVERRAHARRPKLSLAFDRESGVHTETVTALHPDGTPAAHWPAAHLRFEVTNARGKDAADDVEVLLTAVRIVEHDLVRVIEISFPGFQWTHHQTTRLMIPPGVTRSVDICRVHENAPVGSGYGGQLELAVLPEPGDGRHKLAPGKYELVLALAARNADAVEIIVDLVFDPTLSEKSAEQLMVVGRPRVVRMATSSGRSPVWAIERVRRRWARRG
jgi:hypothetical protein